MIDSNKNEREQQLNAALEAIYFGFRAITAQPDARLASLGYSRIHHRILFFIARNPGCNINVLLGIMRISKQYLHRPLQQLIKDGYIQVSADPADRRMKRLQLSKTGSSLEKKLSGDQREHFEQVFAQAGPQAETGWRKVMDLLARSMED